MSRQAFVEFLMKDAPAKKEEEIIVKYSKPKTIEVQYTRRRGRGRAKNGKWKSVFNK